jgi:SAM-dependent methyltransferase
VSENPFVQRAFRAAPERARGFARLASRHLPSGPALRILDVGCGSGEELAHLIELVPGSSGAGVDISASNILHAAETIGPSSLGSRLQFHAADYLDFKTAAFDAIISDSTLQNIPVPDERLYTKIAQDLKAGGVLICSMPYGCLYNRFLWTIRRCLRLVRSRATDRLILALGQRMTGGKMGADLLLERVHYMYLIPHRIGGAKLDALLAGRYGLERLAEVPLPWASLAQPKHRLYVYRKAVP